MEEWGNLKSYQIKEKIGQGGMAEVYRAYQHSLGREVAIKKIHPHLLQDEKYIQRFMREARLASSLIHPHIVTIHDFGREGDVYYLVMEFLKGRSLEYYLSSQLPFPFEIGLIVLSQVSEGLAYAHQQGVVHRDIKPANIILLDQGSAKLTDFGIAQIKEKQSITPENVLVGTSFYIAPEQIRGGKVTPQADIFSLGVVLYQVLCGKLPFDGENTAEVLSKILKGDYPPPRKLNSALPSSLVGLVEKCLAVEVTNRYQKVEEITEEINRYLFEIGLVNFSGELKNYLAAPEEYAQQLKKKKINFYLEQGKKFHSGGEFHQAIAQFELVLNLDPQNSEVAQLLKKISQEHYQSAGETEDIPRPPARQPTKFSFRFIFWPLLVLLTGLSFLLFLRPKKKIISPPPSPPVTKEKVESKPVPSLEKEEKGKPIIPQESERTGKPKKQRKKEEVSVVSTSGSPKSSPTQNTQKTQKTQLPEEKKEAGKKEEKYGFLTIFSHPYTNVYIDGKFYLRAPFFQPLKLTVGEHQLKLTHPRFPGYEGTIMIEEGIRVHYKMTLQDHLKGIWKKERFLMGEISQPEKREE